MSVYGQNMLWWMLARHAKREEVSDAAKTANLCRELFAMGEVDLHHETSEVHMTRRAVMLL